MRRELAPLVLQRKQAEELANQVQNDLYLCELERLAFERAATALLLKVKRQAQRHTIAEDIFGSDSSDSE